MWNLEDEKAYVRVHSFIFSEAFTYADTRPGHTDKEKRERIRIAASKDFPQHIPKVGWWAFRIFVRKAGNRPFDIENVPKLVVDAFWKLTVGSGFVNSVLTWASLFDKELLWPVSLGFISQEHCIIPSPEGIEGRGSFLMRETSKCSLPKNRYGFHLYAYALMRNHFLC